MKYLGMIGTGEYHLDPCMEQQEHQMAETIINAETIVINGVRDQSDAKPLSSFFYHPRSSCQ
jgi:hypothetical protein